MNFEGLPTAARNVAHVDDYKIAVPLGLELVHLRPIAVVEGPGSLTEIFWTERDFSTNKHKVTKTIPTEINKRLTKLINVPGKGGSSRRVPGVRTPPFLSMTL